MNHSSHEQIRTLIENSITENIHLEPETQSSVNAHLAICADCRSFAKLISHLKSGTWNPYPQRTLTAAEEASLLRKIMPQTQKPQFSTVPEAGKRRSMPPLPKPWAAASLAALGIIVIGLFFSLLQVSDTRLGDEDNPSVKIAAVGSEALATLPAPKETASEPLSLQPGENEQGAANQAETNQTELISTTLPIKNLTTDRYYYTKSASQAFVGTSIGGEQLYSFMTGEREFWIAEDGSGRIWQLYTERKFLSEADRLIWEKFDTAPEEPLDIAYGPGEMVEPIFFSLPSEPMALTQLIEERTSSVAYHQFNFASGLMHELPLESGLRSALHQVISQIDGVESNQEATDRLGRRAITLSMEMLQEGTKSRKTLFFDPETYYLFAEEEVLLEQTQWHDAEPGTVISWRVNLESGWVGSTDETLNSPQLVENPDKLQVSTNGTQGEYYYAKSEFGYLTNIGDSFNSVDALVPTIREHWVSKDGSSRVRQQTQELLFFSEEDRIAYSEMEGSGFNDDKDELYVRGEESDFVGLPSDLSGLRAELAARADERGGDIFHWASVLFQEVPLNPEQRSALFQILAEQPDVQRIDDAKDRLDRPAVALQIPVDKNGSQSLRTLYFDPETYVGLSDETEFQYSLRRPEVPPGTLTYWLTTLESGWVDSMDETLDGPLVNTPNKLIADEASSNNDEVDDRYLSVVNSFAKAFQEKLGHVVAVSPTTAPSHIFDNLFGRDVTSGNYILTIAERSLRGEPIELFSLESVNIAISAANAIQPGGAILTMNDYEGRTATEFVDIREEMTPKWWRSGQLMILYRGDNTQFIEHINDITEMLPLASQYLNDGDAEQSQVRIVNAGTQTLEKVSLTIDGEQLIFNDLDSGQTSAYQSVDRAYQTADFSVDGRSYVGFGIQNNSTVLKPGAYTYVIESGARGGIPPFAYLDDNSSYVDELLIDTKWFWEYVTVRDGNRSQQFRPSPLDEKSWPFIEFTATDNPNGSGLWLNGHSGCNAMSGSYFSNERQNLVIPPLVMTAMSCEGKVGELEELLRENLHGISRYEILGDKLLLDTVKGNVLTFSKEQPEPEPVAPEPDGVVVLPPRTHIVKEGETLSSIAELYDVAEDEIRKDNYLTNASQLYKGQMLRLPQSLNPNKCLDPRSVITSPHNSAVVSGSVDLMGSATNESFNYYKIEYAPGADATNGFVYFDGSDQSVEAGQLGVIDTTSLADGPYTLQLIVVDHVGNFPPPCRVTVTVANQNQPSGSNTDTDLAKAEVEPLPAESNNLASPPAGLIYRHDNGHWRMDKEGNAQRLTDDGPHPLFLSFSPSGTRALQIRPHGSNYWLYTFTTDGVSIDQHRFDYPRTSAIGWLDEEKVIVSVQYEGEPLQDGLSHLGFLDVEHNKIQLLEPESMLLRPPQVLTDGTMAYQRDSEIVLWRGDETEVISIESLNLPGELLQFALSPNGHQIVSLVEGDFNGDGWAYIKSDLNGDGPQILHTTTPLSIETALPLGITWSPDSRWLVLVPLTASLNEPLTGPQILLVSSDGSHKKKLGLGVSLFTEWVNKDTVLFITGRAESELETYLYHVDINQRQKVELPIGADLVQLVKTKPDR